MPRLALPLPRLSLDWLGPLASRTTWLYVGFTLVLFLVFLVATFPHDLVVRRALSAVDGGGRVQVTGARFAWFRGYEIDGVRVAGGADGTGPPVLEVSRLWVRPSLRALLRGNPYAVDLRAELYGGQARGTVGLANGVVTGGLAWEGLDLGRYRTLTAALDDGTIAGRLSGTVGFEGRGNSIEAVQAEGDVVIDSAALAGVKVEGFVVPDLAFRQVRFKYSLRGGRLEIQEFVAGGDVSVQGSGQVIVRQPVSESALNLRATILPTATTPDGVKAMIALIPRPPGAKPDAPLTITGTLVRPRVR